MTSHAHLLPKPLGPGTDKLSLTLMDTRPSLILMEIQALLNIISPPVVLIFNDQICPYVKRVAKLFPVFSKCRGFFELRSEL